MTKTALEKSLAAARRQGRVQTIKHARLFGPYISWRQIETWFVLGLGKNSAPLDQGRIVVGLLVLREIAINDCNLTTLIMVNAAIVQITDRIRAVKQELRRQIRRSACHGVSI